MLALVLAGSGAALAQEEGSSDQQEASAAEPVQRAFIRASGDAGALAERYPHLAQWLEPEATPRVLALVERESTGAPEGAMVILADEGQSANAPLLEALRSRLTRAGWATMTLGLEQDTPTLQLARERLLASAAQDDDDDDGGGDAGSDGPVMIDVNDQAAEDLLNAHREEMNARLASAVAWFTERDYPQVVLVGIGAGAETVRAYLAEAPQGLTAAAWVVADFGPRPPSDISESLASAGGLPLLDMYAARDPDSDRRRATFRRVGIKGYEALSAPVGVQPDRRDAGAIASRLVGWARQD